MRTREHSLLPRRARLCDTCAVEPRARRETIGLAIIVACAFALRIAFILAHRNDILFDYPVVDEESYVKAARTLAAGLRPESAAWYQPPGLVYALTAIFRVAGPGLLVPRIVQAAVSAGSCIVAFVIARRLFSNRVAIASSIICALHGVLVFESYELLPATWIVAADLVMLWLLLRAIDKPDGWRSFYAGLGIGVSAVFSPVVLPFAVPAALSLRRASRVAALVAGIALPIAPVTWGNWQRGHELVLVSTNGGLNFFLGNNADYPATLDIRPGRQWQDLTNEPWDAGATRPGQASAYFLEKGLSFYRNHPIQGLGLFARKVALYFHGAEIPRDTDIYAARKDSSLLRLLVWRGPPAVPDGILVPLAIVGAAAAWPERRRLFALYGFLIAQALVVAAFFVTSRYRAPALPVLAMFACVGVVGVWKAWTDAKGLRRLVPIAGFVVLAIGLNVPVREAAASFAAEQEFYRGLALLRYHNDPRGAIEHFRAAAAQNPSDGRIWFELGNAQNAVGHLREAAEAWNRSGEVDPWDSRARRSAAVALRKMGDLHGAIGAIEANVAARQHPEAEYASDHLNLAMLRMMVGQDDRAVQDLKEAERVNPQLFGAQIVAFARGALESIRGGGAGFWLALGDEVRKYGPDEAARACWQRGLETNPPEPQATQLRERMSE